MCSARSKSRWHIGINAHLLAGHQGYRRAGIHHYMAHLLQHLPAGGEAFHYSLFSRHAGNLSLNPAVAILPTRWPTERRLVRILWEQLALPLAAARLRLDLLHSMAFVSPVASSCPSVVTVYDLSFVHQPDSFPTWQRRYLLTQTRRSCRQARRVVTISESGRQDVNELFGLPLEKIDVIYPGLEPGFSPRPAAEVEAFRKREGLPEKFILHVGTLQPRKNISLIVEAFAQLDRPGLELVLVGGKGWIYDEIFARVKTLSLEDKVRFTGYVPDSDLPLWYNAAAMLVFASAYEGFGLPIAQAMACGLPVVAARTSAVPEVAGQAARLFAPGDKAALVRLVGDLLDDPESAATMREEGLEQAAHFSWERAGRDLLRVYQKALGDR